MIEELTEFAREFFVAQLPVETGTGTAPLSAHLRQRAESLKRKGVVLDDVAAGELPEPPSDVAYLWESFLGVHAARTWSDRGPNPIGWADLAAFISLSPFVVEWWEPVVFRAIDAVFLDVWVTHHGRSRRADDSPEKRGRQGGRP